MAKSRRSRSTNNYPHTLLHQPCVHLEDNWTWQGAPCSFSQSEARLFSPVRFQDWDTHSKTPWVTSHWTSGLRGLNRILSLSPSMPNGSCLIKEISPYRWNELAGMKGETSFRLLLCQPLASDGQQGNEVFTGAEHQGLPSGMAGHKTLLWGGTLPASRIKTASQQDQTLWPLLQRAEVKYKGKAWESEGHTSWVTSGVSLAIPDAWQSICGETAEGDDWPSSLPLSTAGTKKEKQKWARCTFIIWIHIPQVLSGRTVVRTWVVVIIISFPKETGTPLRAPRIGQWLQPILAWWTKEFIEVA